MLLQRGSNNDPLWSSFQIALSRWRTGELLEDVHGWTQATRSVTPLAISRLRRGLRDLRRYLHQNRYSLPSYAIRVPLRDADLDGDDGIHGESGDQPPHGQAPSDALESRRRPSRPRRANAGAERHPLRIRFGGGIQAFRCRACRSPATHPTIPDALVDTRPGECACPSCLATKRFRWDDRTGHRSSPARAAYSHSAPVGRRKICQGWGRTTSGNGRPPTLWRVQHGTDTQRAIRYGSAMRTARRRADPPCRPLFR